MTLIVDNSTGQLIIQDGNESAGYVLTSDATGATYWAAGGGGGGAFTADGTMAAYQGDNVDAGAGYNIGSFAQGNYATASGNNGSFAQGYRCTASGNYGNFAQGQFLTASGRNGSFAQGYSIAATGSYGSFAQGRSCTASSSFGNFAQGWSATASGSNGSFAQGRTVVSSGSNGSFAQGFNATASGSNGSFAQGRNCTASAASSWAVGYYASANKRGQFTRSSGRFAATGDAQYSTLIARNSTTTATQTELFLNGSSERITIATDTTWAFSIIVTARRTDVDGESAAYKLEGCIDNNSGTTALVGTVFENVLAEDTAAWSVTAEADNTNDALVIKVTGEAAKTIRWVAKVDLVEVTG